MQLLTISATSSSNSAKDRYLNSLACAVLRSMGCGMAAEYCGATSSVTCNNKGQRENMNKVIITIR
jgi:hypothetical protein